MYVTQRTTVSVVVPSYRRPEMLTRCLAGLSQQTHSPDEIVVVRRVDDAETASVIGLSPIKVVEVVVQRPGLLAALIAGTACASGEVIAFTDDDAVPRPTWVSGLLTHYASADVGGVGGRDVVPGEDRACIPSSSIGLVGQWGRTTGGHHQGAGPVVDVDLLKGVNMSFRRAALAVPDGLRGEGAQVHNEMCMSLWARTRGWRLLYDPSVVVDHYTGPRFDLDGRGARPARAVRDEAFNLVLGLTSLRRNLWLRRALYGLLVGDRATPGLLRAVVAALQRDRAVLRMLVPSLLGQVEALMAVLVDHPVVMTPVEASQTET